MGLKEWFIEKILMSQVNKLKENKIVKMFIGDESKKRYIVAIYIAIRAAYEGLQMHGVVTHPWPVYIDTLAGAFGVWAGADALKKLEPPK